MTLQLDETLSKVQQQTQYYSVQDNDMISLRLILYWVRLNQGDNYLRQCLVETKL